MHIELFTDCSMIELILHTIPTSRVNQDAELDSVPAVEWSGLQAREKILKHGAI